MISWMAPILAVTIFLSVTSCESDNSSLRNTFEAPEFIRKSVPDSTRLSATVTIDGRSVYTMQFDSIFTEASIELEGLAGESHVVSLVFRYLYETQLIDIVIASRIYNPETDNGLVSFSQADYQDFPDDDGDGVSNLTEINMGTY